MGAGEGAESGQQRGSGAEAEAGQSFSEAALAAKHDGRMDMAGDAV